MASRSALRVARSGSFPALAFSPVANLPRVRDSSIDYDVTIKATHGPVPFGDTTEGMFGLLVRFEHGLDAKKRGQITNA